jgi:RNA polymerase sigma factor (sigma-70 family)
MKNETTIAIADIFTEHGREMQARARRILGSDADAEDAVQEAMVSMLRSPHLFAGVERFGAWLFTLVKRRCVDIVRKDTRRKAREAEVGIDDLFEHDDPGELMERTEFANAVADAVKQLPEKQKEVFVQNALEMKTFKEISEATGAPMGTLMARKKKAVDTIRGRLNRQGYSL